MNKEWSEQNKRMQSLLKKADAFEQGKEVLFELRNNLMNTLLSFKEDLSRDDFDAMPFSRHWIMHIEACLRISGKILK